MRCVAIVDAIGEGGVGGGDILIHGGGTIKTGRTHYLFPCLADEMLLSLD